MICISIIILLKLTVAFGLFIDNSGYLGCYVNNLLQHEFNTFAGHLDHTKLTPQLCVKACSAIGFSLAAIEKGKMCFCKKSNTIFSVKDVDANCLSIPCVGDPLQACGSQTNLLVYGAGPLSTISKIAITSLANQKLNSTSAISIFSPINIELDFIGTTTNLFINDNREDVGNGNLSDVSSSYTFNYTLVNTGQRTFELIISPSTGTSYQSSRISTGLPYVIDSLRNISLSCPNSILYTDNLNCTLSFVAGTNLQATISYGDGAKDTCNLMDVNTEYYGGPVPKFLETNELFNMGTQVYLATNAEIKIESYLRAIELYAESAGSIQIDIMRWHCGSSGQVPRNFDYTCDSLSLSTTYSCASASSFSTTNQTCSNTLQSSRFASYQSSAPMSLTSIATFSLNMKQGYNLFTESDLVLNLQLLPGDLIQLTGVSGGGAIGVDMSGDASLTDYLFSSNYVTPINSASNWRFYIRAIVSPNKMLSVFHNYTSIGIYNVSLSLSNIISGYTQLISQSVIVESPITGLQILTVYSTTICFLNVACGLQALVLTGSNLKYQWTITSSNVFYQVNSTQNTISYAFNQTNDYNITVYVSNTLSNAMTTATITVQANLIGLYFKSGNSSLSSSIVNQNANFLFYLVAGANYNCSVDYGDGTFDSFSDSIYNLNNTNISHVYSSERIYKVYINCTNPVNSLNLTFNHTVQYPLVGLALTSNGTRVKSAYSVKFTVSSGSAPYIFGFFFDNTLDTGALYSNLAGQSSSHSAETSPSIHQVYIYICNYVSCVQLNGTFEISLPISGANFTIVPTNNILTGYTYSYPTQLQLRISMLAGSNILIYMNTDSSSSYSALASNLFQIQTYGDWFSNINDLTNRLYAINYTYSNPGDYTIFVNISNVLGYASFTQTVRVISRVDSLIPGLAGTTNNYVTYLSSQSTGTAQFVFSYSDNTKAGSHSTVTFWPGDTNNATFGPFPLSMDFNANVSKTQLQYDYSSTGVYQVSFYVANPLGSKVFTYVIQVVSGMNGFYISVDPLYSPVGSAVTVSSYLMQGQNVSYTWTQNGVTFATTSRLSRQFIIPDNQQYIPSTVGNYSILVKATDSYSTINDSYTLEVQNPLSSISVSVSPNTPQINIDSIAASRTFVFTINYYPTTATNVYYIIDFGDNSLINLPTFMSSSTKQISYTYATSGLFNVNITLFNKVSSFSQAIQVEIDANFFGFYCAPYWRALPTDSSVDIPYNLTNGSYYVKKEYDIRFYCTWLRLDAVALEFDLYFNGVLMSTITNIASLTKLSYTHSTGYIIPYASSLITSQGPLQIQVKNSLFSQTSVSNIIPISVPLNVKWSDPRYAFVLGSPMTFNLTFDSIGQPSCTLVSYTLWSNLNSTKILGFIGSSKDYCTSAFSTYSASMNSLYLGAYSSFTLTSNALTFSTSAVTQVGRYYLTANVQSPGINSIISVCNFTAVASSSACELPYVDIVNKSSIFYSPQNYMRTDMVILTGTTELNCTSGLANQKQWYLYKVNDQTGALGAQISLSSNPTVNYAQLVIQPSTLSFGLYSAIYQVSMSYNPTLYTDTAQTYFEVAPTGIAIASLPGTLAGGTFEQTIGTNQTILLDPVTYSYDLDSLANISALSFKFYCKVIDNGVEYDYPQLFYGVNLDLLTLLNNYSSNQNIQQFFNPNNSHSCFKSINDFSFDATKNKLTIRAGGLAYVAKRIYEVLVQTSYFGATYYQLLRFNVQNVNSVPLLSLGCKISGLCIPYEDYVKINPSTELLIDGDCQSGCTNLFDLEYKFNLYQSWYLPPKQVWYQYNNNSGILGSTTKELVLETNLFSENPLVVIWKIEFYLTATTATNGIASGTASMLIKVNQLPTNGTCSISPSSGISGNTTFVISCSNWVDSDGYVSSYSFNSLYSGQQTTTSIGSNSIGSISSQLPVGAVYDSYNLYISVNIIDNDNGVTTYQIPNPVVVQPAQSDLASIIQQLLDPNSPNSLNSILYSGNSQLTTQTILSISSMLNGASLSDQLALAALGNSTLPATFGALSSYDGVVATPNMTEEQYIANQNLQAQLRQYLSSFINNISVSNIDSILQQSAMLNELTSSTDSITRTMADSVTNQCIRLIEALMNLSSDTSSQDINTAAVSLSGTLGNIVSGLSTYLNGRVSSLDLDQESSDALPTYYDTDLENFWTNPNNFFGDYGPDATQAQVALSKNIQYQQFLNVDVAQKVNTITDLIGDLVASRFATGQSYNMVTSSLAMQVSKLQATNLPNQMNIENAVVQMPTFCDLTTNSNSITTTTTSSPYINPMDSYNCTNRIITLKTILLPMANSGHNGKNESFIGFSYSIGLSFLDQDGIEIDITNTLKPIELHIPRDSNLLNNDYLYVNVSPTSLNVSAGSQFLPNALFIYAVNASLHIQIKPNNSNIGYLALVKFGSTPILNATAAIYDYWKFLCPNSADYQHVNDSNGAIDSYYLLFMNMKQVKGFRGFVGYGLRELTTSEISIYCSNSNNSITSPPLMGANQSLFTSDFWLKSYTSGCYYYDSNTGKWSNDGMEIYSDTTLIYTHCSTNHLTQFAGGLLIVPNEINLSRLPVNASPLKSPLIYVVTILVTCVYIGFWIWAFKRDRFDANQKGIIILPDNLIGDNYCYEIIVYTGNRREAATDSKVKLVINGDFDETNERLLDSKTRPVFRCGGVDSFLMTVNRPLGTLNYLRVWHDNSGEGAMASWYLRHIIIHDLQTRELFHFPCYSWLAVERSDGKIDRTLGVAGATQLRKIAFEEKRSMRDGHLWLSMFTKPLLSPLMRVDRVECSFLMLYLFMVVHILYYGAVDFEISGEEKIGPFIIHPEQILVGILTNLFVFLLCRLLIAIFKRCKVRITKSSKLKKAIDDNMKINRIEEFSSLYKEDDHKEEETNDPDSKGDKYAQIKESKPKRRLLAPWWIRPTLHLICNVVILACAVLLMIKGIEYGETMCEKWFTSLLISFIISLILWQPLQVILSAYIYVKICKKRSNLSQEFDFEHEFDHEDNKKSLNKYFNAENAIYRTNPFKLTQFENSNLTQYQLTDARNSRVREVRIWQAIREISIYAGFILVLFYVTYTNIGKSAFDYQNAMKKTFVISDEMSSVSDLWTWLMNTAAPGLRANTWYNGQQPYGLAGYTNDVSSRMIGYALLRQVRVRPGSCTLDGRMKPYIDFCDSDYHLSSVDSTDYGYSWSQFNSSFVPPNGMQQVYAAFQYQDSNTLQGYPITGDYNTYFGDGYVYQMRGSLAFLKGNLSLLQQMDWINRETRAVFVEFALYNPNINQVIVAEILIEILPTGRLLTQVRFDPLNLFNEVNGGSGIAVKIFAYVLYLLFIVYFTCMEIKQLVKEGPRLYFSRFWNYVEWLLIVFSLAAFALFFYRLSQAYAVLDFFKLTSGYGYIKLQIVSFWNQVLTASLGACCVFGTIRFLKLFRFYKKIYALALTLKFCIREILGFSIMFAFVWVAFVQMLYLYFYDKLVSYSSPLNAFTTSFECLVGKFDENLMLSTQYALGPIIFVIYPIIMAFMMINIFITIVCEAFKEVRSDIRKSGNELEIMDYFKTKYENWRRNGKTDRSQVSSEKYLDISQKLPQNVDRLIHNLAKAYEEDIYIDKLLSKQDTMQD